MEILPTPQGDLSLFLFTMPVTMEDEIHVFPYG